MSIEADVEGILCLSLLLLLASPALNEVDDVADIVGGCSSCMEDWRVLTNVSPEQISWQA